MNEPSTGVQNRRQFFDFPYRRYRCAQIQIFRIERYFPVQRRYRSRRCHCMSDQAHVPQRSCEECCGRRNSGFRSGISRRWRSEPGFCVPVISFFELLSSSRMNEPATGVQNRRQFFYFPYRRYRCAQIQIFRIERYFPVQRRYRSRRCHCMSDQAHVPQPRCDHPKPSG